MEMPFGNAKDGYKTTAANTVDPKQLAKRLKKGGQESGRSCSFCEQPCVRIKHRSARRRHNPFLSSHRREVGRGAREEAIAM